MKKLIQPIISAVMVICINQTAHAITGSGAPLKYISSCELDLNNDSLPDIALLVEAVVGRELIVLLRTAKGYNAFAVSKGKDGMHLSCHFGKKVKETVAGSRKGMIYETPGTYIQLAQPEGASVAYFWNGKDFSEVWTSD